MEKIRKKMTEQEKLKFENEVWSKEQPDMRLAAVIVGDETDDFGKPRCTVLFVDENWKPRKC